MNGLFTAGVCFIMGASVWALLFGRDPMSRENLLLNAQLTECRNSTEGKVLESFLLPVSPSGYDVFPYVTIGSKEFKKYEGRLVRVVIREAK